MEEVTYVLAVLFLMMCGLAWMQKRLISALEADCEIKDDMRVRAESELLIERDYSTKLIAQYQSQLQSAQAEIRALEDKLRDMRDDFAAKAMQAIISNPEYPHACADVSTNAYEYADAMLEARK